MSSSKNSAPRATTARLSAAINSVPLTPPFPAHANSSTPYRPKTDQEVKDWLNHLRAQPTTPADLAARSLLAHHGAPSSNSPRTTAHQGAPQFTAAHHPTPIPRNKPTSQNDAISAHQGAPSTPPARTTAHHGAPKSTAAHHSGPIQQIEPTGQNDALTPLQLAAIRHLLAGYRPTTVARALNIDRHTLLRWRRSPIFQSHLHRLHLQLLQSPRSLLRGSPPQTQQRRINSTTPQSLAGH